MLLGWSWVYCFVSFAACSFSKSTFCFYFFFPPALPLTRNAGKAVTMSGGLDVLQMKEEDVLKFLAAGTHLGGTNLDFQMEQYVYKRKSDGEWCSSHLCFDDEAF